MREFGVAERAKFNAGPSTSDGGVIAEALLRPREPILAQADADDSHWTAQLDLRARRGCPDVEDVDVLHATYEWFDSARALATLSHPTRLVGVNYLAGLTFAPLQHRWFAHELAGCVRLAWPEP